MPVRIGYLRGMNSVQGRQTWALRAGGMEFLPPENATDIATAAAAPPPLPAVERTNVILPNV